MPPQQRPYGTWKSPITTAIMTGDYRLYDAKWDTLTDTLVWHERRASEHALVIQSGSNPRDLVREQKLGGRVMYGGGGFTVGNGQVYYVGAGSRIYTLPVNGGTPRPITPAFGDAATPTLSPDGDWLLYVHSYEGRDALVIVPTDTSQYPVRLVDDTDFVMHPAWHPDGNMLACITWNHPHMPWNQSQLHLITLNESKMVVTQRRVLAGDGGDESVFGAVFSPDGKYLAYSSDRDGWWQIYLYDLENDTHTCITPDEAEYGLPAWIQDMRTFAWTGDSRAIYALRNADSSYTLERIDIASGQMERVNALTYTYMEQIAVSPVTGEVAMIAGGSRRPDRVVTYDPENDSTQIRAYSSVEAFDDSFLAKGVDIAWTNKKDVTIHGLYYAPTNPNFAAEGPPPLIVHYHSGPTRQRFDRYFPEVHYLTSRGFAVLEPNYRGSTGYGRAFMNMLHGNYGVAEIEDAASGVEMLVEQGMADRTCLVAFGSSSGGFSALQSLILMPSVYCAGIAQAPVTDQFELIANTHKFERHYNDTLLGTLPEAATLYRERSPVLHAQYISDPVALFHGKNDYVVSYQQSQEVANILSRKGVATVYRLYDDEGHSFRKPETLRDMFDTMIHFLEHHVVYAVPHINR
ncbi:MAG: prolyl oligopeptidase family serine peptidase [Chloroflexota bacterium]